MLSIPTDYEVLLLDLKSLGSFNFATIYENGKNIKGAYLDSGTRSSHSISMGRNVFDVEVIGSSRESNYSFIPDSIWIPCDISFFHLTSSNEAEGNQQMIFPIVGAPYICDMSSDLFSREINTQAFDLIYANGGYNF